MGLLHSIKAAFDRLHRRDQIVAAVAAIFIFIVLVEAFR